MSASDTAYKASNLCVYSYFPQYTGTSDDGINANRPDGQPNEFFNALHPELQECFASGYGAKTYVDMLGSSPKPVPMVPNVVIL